MKRLGLILAALLAASPAWAADQWNALTVSAGACAADDAIRVVYAPRVACIDRSKTSAASTVTIIDFTTPLSPSVTTVNGPSPSTASYGNPLGLALSSTEIAVCGGGTGSTGWWCAVASNFSGPSWTLTLDNLGTTFAPLGLYGVLSLAPPGSKTYMAGRMYTDPGVEWIAGTSFTASPFSVGSMSGAGSGGASNTSSNQITGVKVSSSYYVTYAAMSSAKIYASGNDGTTTNTFAEAFCTGSLSASRKIRQPFGHNAVNGIVALYDGSSNTFVCSEKSTGGHGVNQTLSSVDVRTGVSWNPTGSALRPFLWRTTGAAYKGDALDPTTFATDTTYDISSGVLGGATVRAVVNGAEAASGIDMDLDSATTDNPIAFLSANVAWWGQPCVDTDADGYGSPASALCTNATLDCDDTSASVYPGATEITGNGVDEDCSGADTPAPAPAPAARIATPSSYGGAYGGTYGAWE